MSDFPEWLPEEIDFSKFSNFNDIINYAYTIFSEDFIENQISFLGLPVYLKRSPLKNGKDATFFHLLTRRENVLHWAVVTRHSVPL